MSDDPNAPANRANNCCRDCGRCCNESESDRPHVPPVQGSRDW
ncbi:hypothetical protein OHR68_19780 [Spirillospora sp. NBC_00431]